MPADQARQPVLGMGLDLANVETITEAEKAAFAERFRGLTGRPHLGLNYLLEQRPDVLKRYRAWADRINIDVDGQSTYNPNGYGFLLWYALHGFVAGVRYLVHVEQRMGLTREQVLEGVALAFMWGGPRGMETVALALGDYDWQPPGQPPDFPANWTLDHHTLGSGLDFSVAELSLAELDLLGAWHRRVEGEVPAYVGFMAANRPRLLKAYRNRFENTLLHLPVQVMPYVMIHVNVQRGFREGIRESVLLARGLGMTRAQTLEAISWGMFYGGMESGSIVAEAVGDVLAGW